MIIQSPSIEYTDDGRLYASWITMERVYAIQIAVALDSEFTQNVVQFALPENTLTCVLNLGRGDWYIRIGGWSGTELKGIVKWSGILGPIHLESPNDPIQAPQSQFTVAASKELENGYRLMAGKPYQKMYAIELSTDPQFRVSDTKALYVKDVGIGEVDVTELLPETTYWIRYAILNEVPTNAMITLAKGNIINSVKAKVVKIEGSDVRMSSSRTQLKSDMRIVEEMKTKPAVRFSSYSDYLRYLATKSSH